MSFETRIDPVRPSVRSIVRHYTSFSADVGVAIVTRAAPVRPQQFLQLVLEGNHQLRNIESGRIVRSPPAALIGLCTYRKYNLIVEGRLRLFFVQFQPGALHALSGLDMQTLTDGCLDAAAVFGDRAAALLDTLRAAPTAAAQGKTADAWFAEFAAPKADAVTIAALRIRDAGAGVPEPVDLSARQFQRRFARQVGVTPKVYARLCRLSAVLELHDADASLSWTELAHEGGYADQAHLTREFRAFVRAAPSRFRRYELIEHDLGAAA